MERTERIAGLARRPDRRRPAAHHAAGDRPRLQVGGRGRRGARRSSRARSARSPRCGREPAAPRALVGRERTCRALGPASARTQAASRCAGRGAQVRACGDRRVPERNVRHLFSIVTPVFDPPREAFDDCVGPYWPRTTRTGSGASSTTARPRRGSGRRCAELAASRSAHQGAPSRRERWHLGRDATTRWRWRPASSSCCSTTTTS